MGNYTAVIGGTPVNVVAGSLHIENQIGQRSQGSMTVWSGLNTAWLYGTRVLIYNDQGALAYTGYTSKDKASKPGGAPQGTGYLEHQLQLMDNAYRADKRRVFKTYLSTAAGAIATDLFNTYLAPEGCTIGAIASGPIITEVIWNGQKSVAAALTWLAQQAGYWWQIDLNGAFWFQPYGGVSAPWTFDGSQAEGASQPISVEFGNDMYINSQFVKGSYATTGTLTETMHGNGVTRAFTLSYEVAKIASVVLNGTDVTAKSLTKGSSGGEFYYAIGDAVLAQDPGYAVLQSTDTLVVTYTGRYPVLANARSQTLINAQKTREGGGTGLVESSYTNTKVRTLAAAFQIANALLNHYGTDTTVLTFSTRQTGLLPGQMLTVNLPDFGLTNKQMLIHSVTISDEADGVNIWFTVEAVGSPVEAAQWQTYWANLMQQSSDPSDYVDASDTPLALLTASVFTTTPTLTTTPHQYACPICNTTTLCNTTTIVC
jgi:hypothetical protein